MSDEDRAEAALPLLVEEGPTTAFGSSLDTLERATAPLMGWAAELRAAGLPWKDASPELGGQPNMPFTHTPSAAERLLAVIITDALLRCGEAGTVRELATSEATKVPLARAICRLRGVGLPWVGPRHLSPPGQGSAPVHAAEIAERYADWIRHFTPAADASLLMATAAADMRVEAGPGLRGAVADALEMEAARQEHAYRGPIERYLQWWRLRRSA